jgi:hypothetical protein
MNFSGPVNITFAPGLYIIKDGVITESGGNFTGNGRACSSPAKERPCSSVARPIGTLLPGRGPSPGFAIFLDPNGPTGLAADFSSLSGQAELYFEESSICPSRRLPSAEARRCSHRRLTRPIGDTLRFVGNGELVINNDTTMTGLPIPTALMVQTNGTLALREKEKVARWQRPDAGCTSCRCCLARRRRADYAALIHPARLR